MKSVTFVFKAITWKQIKTGCRQGGLSDEFL